jgi:predicted RNase H-like HicB family nuclease
MPHYIALIHKDPDTGYGVSFPDVPGVTTMGDTIDDAMHKAADVLAFAAEDFSERTGRNFPAPRTIDALRADRIFQEDSTDAVIALVPFREPAGRAIR